MFPRLDKDVSSKIQKVEGIAQLKYQNILPTHFLWFIVGKPGSGKSSLIHQILMNKDLYYQKFDTVLFLSPSSFANLELNAENVCKELSIDWIYQRVSSLQQQKLKYRTNVLIVIDDFISQLSKCINMPVISQLFFNRRHIIDNATISIIVTAQKYTSIPARIRSIGDSFSFFSLNQRDWQLAKEELIFYDNIQQCSHIIQDIFNQPNHDFVYIRTQPFILAQNFRPLIYEGKFRPFDEDGKEQQPQGQEPQQQQQVVQELMNHTTLNPKKMSFFCK